MNFLFLRGLARNSSHWNSFPQKFEKNSNQVISIDTLGNGEFSNLSSPLKISDYTDHIRNLWSTKKNDDSPWILIAMSMGGMIALDWDNRFPNDFQKIIIINSSASNLVPPWKRFSLSMFLKLPLIIFSNRYKQEEAILNITLSFKAVNREAIESNLKYIPTNKINFLRQLIAASKFKLPTLKSNSNKFVFIVGLKDKLVSPISTIKMASIYQSKLITAQNFGHDIPLEDPEWLFATICDQFGDD